ncbi:MAG: M20/M25/M40 family metallo-hydrolase [Gemmatimonadaceae bacterium]
MITSRFTRRAAVRAAATLALALASACQPHPSPGATPARDPNAVLQPVPTEGIIPASLTPAEVAVRDAVATQLERHIILLEQAVNIASGTTNHAGVRAVGALFARELEALGFTTRWVSVPDSLHRAGHLVAEHPGTRGLRLLLIGHLDTVFEGENQRWVREDTIARGAGSSDMKGGDVAIVMALRALRDAGQLEGMNVSVIMTGDEEHAGRPTSVSRAAMVELARRSDVALAFEGGSRSWISVSRRGSSNWTLRVTARQAHSAGSCRERVGCGAIYEGARVLEAFRARLGSWEGLTFNAALAGGGTGVTVDTLNRLTVEGRGNIIPPVFWASGDLRFLRDAQLDSARAVMRDIVAHSLPEATSEITFDPDYYPAMPATPAGARLVAEFDAVNRALGYGPARAQDPLSRGAGDVSFVAPIIPGIDGLGVSGGGSHSPNEWVNLESLRMAAERAAVLMARLAQPGVTLSTRP